MRGSLRVVVFAIVLCGALVALAPAAWLDLPLAAYTQQRMRLADAEGFWWRGRGALATADGAARFPIAWRIAVAPLLAGALAVHLEGDGASPTGSLTLRRAALELHDLRLFAPAAMLPALVPALNALAWGGDVVLQAPSLTWRDGTGTGRLDATWRRARVIAAGFALDLGTVTMSAAPAGGAVAGTIRNSGGDVAIEGTVDDRAGVVDVALTLTPTSTAPEAVRRMLLLVGPSDGAGGVRMTWRSRR